MQVLVISDSHGNIANLKYCVGFAKEIKAQALIHCGDWDNLKAVEVIKESNIPFYGVRGNADIDPAFMNLFQEKLSIEIDNRKVGVIHNFRDFKTDLKKFDIIFCGHRHFRWEKEIDGVKVVAPGALHAEKPSFAVYETTTNGVSFFDL